MRLIFVRHGDRIGENDEITEKGVRETQLLSERIASWKNIVKIYRSPCKRVIQSAAPSLEKLGMEAEEKGWLREFEYLLPNPTTGKMDIPWDLYPDYYNNIPEFYDKDKWLDMDFYRSNPDIAPAYEEVKAGIDGILKEFGFVRDNNIYRLDPECKNPAKPEDTIVFFSHFGISSIIISYLINVSAPVFLMHFVCPPTGITVLNTEMRLPGSNAAHFRIQSFGDTGHLRENGEPLSEHAAFSSLFNQ